jgi:hypothetical protein
MNEIELIKKGSINPFDHRDKAKGIFAAIIVGVVAWLFLNKILPSIVSIVWNMVSLGIAGIVLFFLFVIIKLLIRNGGIFYDKLCKLLLGWIVEWDEFILQEKQIKQAKIDLSNMDKKKGEIEGEYNRLSSKLISNKKEIEIQDRMAKSNSNKPDVVMDAESAKQRAYSYIETVGPIVKNMEDLIIFAGKAYKQSVRSIKEAELDLNSNKDIFNAVSRGNSLLNSAKAIIFGRSVMNEQAEFAKEKVRQKIALGIGQMKNSMELLTSASSEQALRDQAINDINKDKMKLILNEKN